MAAVSSSSEIQPAETLMAGEGVASADVSGLPKRCPACEGRYPPDFRVCPRDATPLEDAPADEDELVGTTLSETYEVVRVIGEGGMGRVYEARHVRLRTKRYAIKVLHYDLSRQPEVVTRFQREAEAASALLHPNVVGVYDVGRTADGRPYIVAELLEGEQLGELLSREGKLAPLDAIRITRQICRALEAAHERGIVHRDVKPENVCLVGDTVKVLDFGISKVAEAGSDLTRTGVVMGTPAYMAPEQARGDKVDARADVYAVGAILYRAVTGKKPFDAEDQMATLTAVLTEEPPRPRELAPQLPEALELVIQRAMAKTPDERYETMSALNDDLAVLDPERNPATQIAAPSALSLERARAAKMARPAVVGWSVAAGAWLMVLWVSGVLSAIRWLGQSAAPTTTELVLTFAGSAVVFATPTGLWARWIQRFVWRNTPRAIELSERLRFSLALAVVGYGVCRLLVELWQTALLRAPAGIAHPGWSLLGLVVSVAFGAAAWFLKRALKR